MQVHERLKAAREAAGLEPGDVAAALKVTVQTVYGWEKPKAKGGFRPAREKEPEVARLYGLSTADFATLLNGRDDEVRRILTLKTQPDSGRGTKNDSEGSETTVLYQVTQDVTRLKDKVEALEGALADVRRQLDGLDVARGRGERNPRKGRRTS